MATDTATPSTSSPLAAKSKTWKYVGPGSEGSKIKGIPLVGNLPLDPANLRLGTRQGPIPANEVPADLLQYVMDTNTHAKGWWVNE